MPEGAFHALFWLVGICPCVRSSRLQTPLEASWSHQLSAQALLREGSWKDVWEKGKRSIVDTHLVWESVGPQRGRNNNQTETPLIGCLLCATPRLSTLESQNVRNPPAAQGGTYYSCPRFTHKNIGTHTAGMWQIQDLNSRLLPTTVLISQATNNFWLSSQKRN